MLQNAVEGTTVSRNGVLQNALERRQFQRQLSGMHLEARHELSVRRRRVGDTEIQSEDAPDRSLMRGCDSATVRSKAAGVTLQCSWNQLRKEQTT